jgi:hypothetical protein
MSFLRDEAVNSTSELLSHGRELFAILGAQSRTVITEPNPLFR